MRLPARTGAPLRPAPSSAAGRVQPNTVRLPRTTPRMTTSTTARHRPSPPPPPSPAPSPPPRTSSAPNSPVNHGQELRQERRWRLVDHRLPNDRLFARQPHPPTLRSPRTPTLSLRLPSAPVAGPGDVTPSYSSSSPHYAAGRTSMCFK